MSREMNRSRSCSLLASLLLPTLLCACPKKKAGATDAGASTPSMNMPVPIQITAERTDLIFSYQDADGKFHDVTHLADVPEPVRKQVLVRDLSHNPEELHADEYLYVADLTEAVDGGYPYALVSRYRFRLPEISVDDDGGVHEGANVVVYGTSWCGACAEARKFFTAKGIAFEDKDIEKDQAAAEELARKAKRAHLSFRGVPVIDVKGHLMEGFDPHACEQALRGG